MRTEEKIKEAIGFLHAQWIKALACAETHARNIAAMDDEAMESQQDAALEQVARFEHDRKRAMDLKGLALALEWALGADNSFDKIMNETIAKEAAEKAAELAKLN